MADKFHLIPLSKIAKFAEPDHEVVTWETVDIPGKPFQVLVQTQTDANLMALGLQVQSLTEEVHKAQRTYAYLNSIAEAPEYAGKPEQEIASKAMALLNGDQNGDPNPNAH